MCVFGETKTGSEQQKLAPVYVLWNSLFDRMGLHSTMLTTKGRTHRYSPKGGTRFMSTRIALGVSVFSMYWTSRKFATNPDV